MVALYEYAIPKTGEIITLKHRYEYVSEVEAVEATPEKTLRIAA